jgi:fatty acid desaturase
MQQEGAVHAARLSVDYPDRELNRATTFFRLFAAIPIVFVLASVSGWMWQASYENGKEAAAAAGGLLFLGPLLMILFRQKYPRWWFDFNLQLTRFSTRVTSYLALMSDRYPSTDEEQSVHLDLDYPDVKRDLNRFLPLVKWLLAIPHYVVLLFLGIAAVFAVVIAWFAILFTGRYPRGLFNFVEGVMRWGLRVEAYSMLLVTDKYPPFRLAA